MNLTNYNMIQVKMYIVFSCIWGFCGNIHEKSRKPLSDFMRPILKKYCADLPDDKDLYQIVVDDTNVEFVRTIKIKLPIFVPDCRG
jgi:hypothetical protein